MTPDEYRAAQQDLSMRAEQITLAVAASSTLSGFVLASSLGTFLATANDAATRLADAFTASYLRVPSMGLLSPANEVDRLSFVFAGILEDRQANPLPRIARVARTEPVNAGRAASRIVMQRHQVARYRWVLDEDPCPMCLDLAINTFPVEKPPESHPNCSCTTVPVTSLRSEAA